MYEHIATACNVFFEGMADPVFYGHYYSMGDKTGPYAQALWREFHYSQGLKLDKDKDGIAYREYAKDYERDLRWLLDSVCLDANGARKGVVVIPSSRAGVTNRVCALVRSILASNPNVFDDLTRVVTRTSDKATAHMGGDRSYRQNYDTIGVSRHANLARYGVILVIDDILTSGTSFRVMDDRLRASGFAGTIVNFALSRTFPSEGAACCWEFRKEGAESARRSRLAQNASSPIEALVFDLDQTLLDDGVRDLDHEVWLASRVRTATPHASPYALYDGIDALDEARIPFAIVSNRPMAQLRGIIDTGALDGLYSQGPLPGTSHLNGDSLANRLYGFDGTHSGTGPRNVFTFPQETVGNYTARYYKPSPRGVNNALDYLRSEFLDQRQEARIVGLGNTYEDIVAYGSAGIESALALWGVPVPLREHADLAWGADHVFESPLEFKMWVMQNAGYYKIALALEEEDPERAVNYYILAIKAGDNAVDAAFRVFVLVRDRLSDQAASFYERAIAAGDERWATFGLALLVSDDDPERARALYERAIEAGDELYATHNLAVLIMDGEPDRAKALFERAIAAGNERWATSGLARLIEREDPDRAKVLYERAIAAGDERYSTSALADLIADKEPGRAKSLYERAIAAGDELNATNGLAVLLEGEDPVRARALYERAIAAGDERYATKNLANNVLAEEPERAWSLYERAIAAGDELNATFGLAVLLTDKDPERAKALYERAIAAGDDRDATNNLAVLLADEHPDRARPLYERAIAAGNERWATRNLANLIKHEDPEQAKTLYERAIAAGDERYATNGLGQLLEGRDPKRAKTLYERAIAAGDEQYATKNLADMIFDEDPNRAMSLYERAIEAGDERYATFGLALLLQGVDPERAKTLYERAIAAGDERYATKNLAYLIKSDDPVRAKALYERAIAAGDEEYATNSLANLIADEDPERARSLYERAIAAGDERYATNGLALLLEDEDPGRAKTLYERAIAAGSERYATKNLANLISDEEPKRAKALYERAIAAGDERYATNSLGILIAEHDPDGAIALFERAMAAGDDRCATCNLAHLIAPYDTEKAAKLYERSIAYGEAEAMIGLAFLIRETDPGRSCELLSRARSANDRSDAVRFLLRFTGYADEDFAADEARFLLANGYDEAEGFIPAPAAPDAAHAPCDEASSEVDPDDSRDEPHGCPVGDRPTVAHGPSARQAELIETYRRALARREDTDPGILNELSRDDDPEIRAIVARNQSTPEDALVALADDTDAVAANPSTPTEVLRRIYRERRALCDLAGNPSTPPSVLERLVLHDYRNVTPRLVSEIVRLNVPKTSMDDNACETAARNAGMPYDTLALLADEGVAWSYRYLACNRNAPSSVLERLLCITAETLGPNSSFQRFVETGLKTWERQQPAAYRLPGNESYYSNLRARARTQHEDGAIAEILYNVASNPAAPPSILERCERRALCSLPLAGNPSTPQEVLARLPRHQRVGGVSVSEALAANPNAPADVLELLSKRRPSALGAIVAGNPSAPPKLVDELTTEPSGHDDWTASDRSAYEDALVHAAENPRAPERVLVRVMDYFMEGHHESDRREGALLKLAENPSAPTDVLERLAQHEQPHLLPAVLLNKRIVLLDYIKERMEL